MLEFMDYIQLAFADATRWNQDNSYSALTATAESLLDFHVPERLQVHLSSLSTPHFATSYTLGTVGLIDGSVSYLFSTVPLNKTPSESALIPLRRLVRGYRQIEGPVPPLRNWGWDAIPTSLSSQQTTIDHASANNDTIRKATLLHATLHLPPPSTLNALFLRRISPTTQITVALVSTQGPPLIKSAPSAALLTQISHDTGTFSNEYLFSTDNALFGWRGLWNIGLDPTPGKRSTDRLSLLSAGAEAYYSPISSLVGLSTGLRFATLPAAGRALYSSTPGGSPNPVSSFPYTLTLTLTPLTGSLSTTYSAQASPNLAFSSRFGFNVYSWESEMVAGCEIWRKSPRKTPAESADGLDWARRKMGIMKELPTPTSFSSTSMPHPAGEDEGDSVIKIRMDQSWNVRLLWEGRVKSLLVTAGVSLGPGTFTAMSSDSASSSVSSSSIDAAGSSTQSTGGGAPPRLRSSYWRGVGVSVLYSS